MIGHLHYIMSSKYELFLFNLLSVALVIINHRGKKGRPKKLGDPNMTKDKANELTPSEKEELIKLRQEVLYLKARLEYEKKLEALVQKRLQKTKKRPK